MLFSVIISLAIIRHFSNEEIHKNFPDMCIEQISDVVESVRTDMVDDAESGTILIGWENEGFRDWMGAKIMMTTVGDDYSIYYHVSEAPTITEIETIPVKTFDAMSKLQKGEYLIQFLGQFEGGGGYDVNWDYFARETVDAAFELIGGEWNGGSYIIYED